MIPALNPMSVTTMNLKSLVHRELAEGMTELQLASAVRVPLRTLTAILAGKDPENQAIWEQFARYFRMDIDFLRTGESTYAKRREVSSDHTSHSAAGHVRPIPLFNWHRIEQLAKKDDPLDEIHAEAMVETTDVSGTRTFALKVQDDSMAPLFSKGEMIFVNPDSDWKAGDFVVVTCYEKSTASTLLRQVDQSGNRYMLHPLNRTYADIALKEHDVMWGKVVRLRKNL
jgi:SOS-response transcriptional repressor LexA